MALPPELKQKIDALFESALKLDPAERTSFLDRACAGNSSLRQEVESRLQAKQNSEPTAAPSHQSTGSVDGSLVVGEAVAHYKILSFLGRGGMGEVYLAQDSRLGRKVALKLLPKSLSHDEERLRRFEREARSASALNHPNVCVIHEIGETADGRPYISMEYIDGETLRKRFARGRFKLSEAIDIAQQTASALAAAHEAGVVHRDIKPENIMLRRDGYVKVLDFGLAKLTERYEAGSDSEAPTFHMFSTHSGAILGTTSYLSPEQARRQTVDERGDIWSLGVVLYEMIAGRLPFKGETPSHIVVSILEKDPEPLAQFAPDVPTELEWIVRKALRKNRDQRYQTVKELIGDFTEVKGHLVAPGSGRESSEVGTPSAIRHTSAFESISQTLTRPRISVGFFVIGIAAVALSVWGYFHFRGAPGPLAAAPVHVKLTNTGKARDAAISGDGKYVVYVAEDNTGQGLWLKHVATGSTKEIVPSAIGQYDGLTFSPDGNYLYYVFQKDDTGTLYQTTVLGGSSKKLVSGVDSNPSVSFDGQNLAFIRHKAEGDYNLMVVKNDGSDERVLSTRTQGEFFSPFGSTAWSPDGKVIACAVGSFAGGYHTRLVQIAVNDGTEKPIESGTWYQIVRLCWSRDGHGLLLAASDQPVVPFQIWYLSYPDGKLKRVTNDSIDYNGLGVTADFNTFVTVQADRLTSIWVMPSGQSTRAREVTSGVGHTYAASWTPAGKILYSSVTGGNLDVSLMAADGSGKTQLTSGTVNYHPSATPDGRYIVFASTRSGSFNIWRMDTDGGNTKQLTYGGADLYPNCSPDSKWIVYQSISSGISRIWKVGIDGGNPTQLTNTSSSFPVVSPDGKTIACRYLDKKAGGNRIAIINFDDGQLVKTFDVASDSSQRVRWAPDGRSLTYIDIAAGVANLWSLPADGGKPRALTDFKNDLIFSYDWSSDGKLVCERGVETSDVILITNYLD